MNDTQRKIANSIFDAYVPRSDFAVIEEYDGWEYSVGGDMLKPHRVERTIYLRIPDQAESSISERAVFVVLFENQASDRVLRAEVEGIEGADEVTIPAEYRCKCPAAV